MSQASTRPSLLSRLRDPRDAEAWREFEAAYRDLLRRYCTRSGLQAADTEDVCQVVLLALTRALPTFHLDSERGRFRSYLGRMVVNAIHRQRTRVQGVPPTIEQSVLELLSAPQDGSVERAWEEEWSHHHLRRALQVLRAQVQSESIAVFERLLRGESVADVAVACGLTTEGVHKIKQRIGERLRVEVERQVRDEEPAEPGSS